MKRNKQDNTKKESTSKKEIAKFDIIFNGDS